MSKRSIRMSIPTEDFIALIQDRPQLWQKAHPDFQDRELRARMLHDVAMYSGVSAQECARKLKMLKDTMRARVALLPKTLCGAPDFSASGIISWPYFHHMLFMKEEFLSKAPQGEVFQLKEELQDEAPAQAFSDPRLLGHDVLPDEPLSPVLACSSSDPFSDFSSEPWCRPSQRKDRDDLTLELLEKLARTDECADFAKDIANDLRKLQDPANLIVTKAAIRRVVEDALLRELKGKTCD